MTDANLTPMLRQDRQLKQHDPDALRFYHLGDFYELFEEDAQTVARELNLTLTSRRFSKKVRLAGVSEEVVAQAEQVMARWEGGGPASNLQPPTEIVRKVGEGLLLPHDDKVAWAVLRDLYHLDIANLTPVQALVLLNQWPGQLRRKYV